MYMDLNIFIISSVKSNVKENFDKGYLQFMFTILEKSCVSNSLL